MKYLSVLCVIVLYASVLPAFSQCPSYSTTNTQSGICSEPAGNITLYGLGAVTLTVDGDLTINGNFTIRDDLVVNGTMIVTGDVIARSGSIIIRDGGVLDIRDDLRPNSDLTGFFEITVEDGGTLLVGNDFEATNFATVDVQEGGSVDVGGDYYSGAGSTTTIDGDFNVDGDFTNESFIVDGVVEGDGNLTVGGTYTNNGVDDDFNGSMNGSPLPVELVYFKGNINENGHIVLKWLTSTEINNSGFAIEKSLNGIDFEEISFQKGYGNSSDEHTYEFVDKHIISGENYYRLKQIDFDGVFEYSPMIRIYSSSINDQLIVYPNPTNGEIRFTGFTSNILLFDDRGKILIETKDVEMKEAESILSKYLTKAEDGIYLLSSVVSGQKQTIRIIKN